MPIMIISVVPLTMQLVDASYAAAVGKRNYFMRKEFLLLFLIGVFGILPVYVLDYFLNYD